MIYFIQEQPDGAIKIGHTATGNVRERLRKMQTGNSRPLRVLGVTDGTFATEGLLHSR